MFRDFKLKSTAYLPAPPLHQVEWLFVMQHYGMPTRLLDWTESHLHALYFALASGGGHGDACVWVLDPWALNRLTIGQATIPASSSRMFDTYALNLEKSPYQRHISANLPVAIRPLQNNPRMIAQKGTFTIFGRRRRPLDEFALASSRRGRRRFLEPILISGNHRKGLLCQVILSGITESVLFPELDGLSRELARKYSNEYMDEA